MRVRLAWMLAVSASVMGAAAWADPSGHRWFAAPTYVVFPHAGVNGLPSGFTSNVLPVIRASYRHWTSDEVGCTSWQSQYGGSFTSPSGLGAVNGNDKINRMLWLGGTQWRYPSNTLAMTTTTFFTGSGEIFDADMEMNNNIPWKVAGGAAAYDVETITTHEAGHFLGLNHSSQASTVMFPTVSLGSIKAALDPLDVADVCGVYPSAEGGGTGMGSPCSADAECEGSLVCRGAPGTGSFICTPACSGGCPQGLSCQAAQSPSGAGGSACLVVPGVADLCTFCTSGQDCLSGICLTTGQQNFCSSACTGDEQCGAGYECYEQYCIPSGSACPSAQCEGAWHCPQGYACMGGMCTATGRTGDRCEVSLHCEPCSLCIGTFSEAFCRSCCGGTGQGGSCNACGAAGCSGGSCLNLEDESGQQLADQVCVPAGSGACELCAGDGDCMQGLACVAGRCHAPCNASASNACDAQACSAPPGTSQAVCACADEIASIGQSCGEVGSSLRLCGYGAVCVGNPGICRTTCAGGCAADATCQLVDGQPVCVTQRREGGTCGACKADGTCDNGLQCLGGRCFVACTLGNPAACDTACVAVDGNAGVCGCVEDQQAAGGPCGLSWDDTPYTCVAGTFCADATCRQPCGAGDACAGEATCAETASGKACIPPGCGCGALPAGGWVPLCPVLPWLWARRRART